MATSPVGIEVIDLTESDDAEDGIDLSARAHKVLRSLAFTNAGPNIPLEPGKRRGRGRGVLTLDVSVRGKTYKEVIKGEGEGDLYTELRQHDSRKRRKVGDADDEHAVMDRRHDDPDDQADEMGVCLLVWDRDRERPIADIDIYPVEEARQYASDDAIVTTERHNRAILPDGITRPDTDTEHTRIPREGVVMQPGQEEYTDGMGGENSALMIKCHMCRITAGVTRCKLHIDITCEICCNVVSATDCYVMKCNHCVCVTCGLRMQS